MPLSRVFGLVSDSVTPCVCCVYVCKRLRTKDGGLLMCAHVCHVALCSGAVKNVALTGLPTLLGPGWCGLDYNTTGPTPQNSSNTQSNDAKKSSLCEGHFVEIAPEL